MWAIWILTSLSLSLWFSGSPSFAAEVIYECPGPPPRYTNTPDHPDCRKVRFGGGFGISTAPSSSAPSSSLTELEKGNIPWGKDKLGMTARIVAAQLDNRNWKIGYEAGQGGVKIVEYVLEGETVENWSELVTWQYFQEWQKKASLVDIYEDNRKLKQQRFPTATWKLISKSDNEIIFWWAVESHPIFGDETSIVRMILGKDGVHQIHYSIKKARLFDSDRDKWIRILRSVRINGHVSASASR